MTTADIIIIRDAFDHDDAHQCFLTATGAARRFALAGRATLTVASTSAEQRYTFKIAADRNTEGLWLVRARCGETFLPIGNIRQGRIRLFWNACRRVVVPDEGVFTAINWLVGGFNALNQQFSAAHKVWHSGQCGRCGRELTSEFRFVGFGPICCGHLGIDPAEELAQLPINEAIEALRAALNNGNKTLARKIAARCKSPVAKDYLAGHAAAA